jgi:hypothetical protein
MNSSTRISPIVAGLRLVIDMACLTLGIVPPSGLRQCTSL